MTASGLHHADPSPGSESHLLEICVDHLHVAAAAGGAHEEPRGPRAEQLSPDQFPVQLLRLTGH